MAQALGQARHPLAQVRGGAAVFQGRRVFGDCSTFDWAMAPRELPRRFNWPSNTPRLERAGSRSRPTQIIECWAAKTAICNKVLSLSPHRQPELVKPAASLSRQGWAR